jgi:hypothetical protein
MISKTCDPCRETLHFAERNEALRFRCFGLLGERKRNTLELAEGALRSDGIVIARSAATTDVGLSTGYGSQ